MPVSPSTDEDEGPLATLPDEDAFAAEAPASRDPGQKQKAKQPKKRSVEAAAIAGASGIQIVSMSSLWCTVSAQIHKAGQLAIAATPEASYSQ